MSLTTLSQQVNVKLWERDRELYFRECLRIQDEHGKSVPLELNVHQKTVHAAIQEQRRLGVPVRVIVLKERKAGTSTLGEAELYGEVRFRPADGLVVAHDVDSTEYLFGIARRFHDNVPPDERLPLEASNRKELAFTRRPDGRYGGRILVKTAGTKTAGRGFTPLYLHCSEVPFYDNAEDVMLALMNSVPDTPESMVIIEGTANGTGGWFHDQYWKAKNGKSGFTAIFLCWKDHDKHRLKVADAAFFQTTLTPYERRIMSAHGLDLEQIAWRRWAIDNKCGGDAEKFKQEYPLTDTEAFLTSGRCRFDVERLNAIRTNEPLRGILTVDETYSGKSLHFSPKSDGYIDLWKRPQPGHAYVIGADVAEGIEVVGQIGNDRYDHSSGDVIDRHTGEQVAQIHGDFEPDEFGRQLCMLGQWYNWAYMGIERNNNGQTTLNEIEHQNYPGDKIFARTTTPDGKRYTTPQTGWVTSHVTRPNMINRLARVAGADVIINSFNTVKEMKTFVIWPDGSVKAQRGSKDDRVFSLGIAATMLDFAPDAEAAAKQESEPKHELRVTTYRPARFGRAVYQ